MTIPRMVDTPEGRVHHSELVSPDDGPLLAADLERVYARMNEAASAAGVSGVAA